MRKFERIKDYLLMEEEYVKNQSVNSNTEDEKANIEKDTIDLLRGNPLVYILVLFIKNWNT